MTKTALAFADDDDNEIGVLGKDEWKYLIPVWMVLLLDAKPLYSGWRERIQFVYFYKNGNTAIVELAEESYPEFTRTVYFNYAERSCTSVLMGTRPNY